MPTKKASASWNGSLKLGNGNIALDNNTDKGTFLLKSRFKDGSGTNPEELIGAAHAACYSMTLATALTEEGFTPKSIQTNAEVSREIVDGNLAITSITLNVAGNILDIDKDTFLAIAEDAKRNCPVSKALAGVNLELDATLQS